LFTQLPLGINHPERLRLGPPSFVVPVARN
jgi:hypothetical protein